MTLSSDDRNEIAELVHGVQGEQAAMRRQYIGLSLVLFEGLQRLNDDLRPIALALLRRGLLSDADVTSAENALAAELAASPKAEESRLTLEQLRRIAAELDAK